METQETEVRFLEIDKDSFVKKLKDLGATDLGETMLEEVIVYDKDLKWPAEKRFIRVRKVGDVTTLCYKQHMPDARDGAREIEIIIDDLDKAVVLLEKIGLVPFRRQQKKRHTLRLREVTFDIDTWPRIPTYVELEGPSMQALQDSARLVGLDWSKVVYDDAKWVIQNVYHIPVGTMHWFTFDRFE